MTSKTSASSTARLPAIRSTASPPAWKLPPVRSGQGIGNSVGMAIAGKWLAARFNRPGFEIFDYNVYAFCGDGDMMEGVGSEAASLAGHLKLSNLCWIYDANQITLEGPADLVLQRRRRDTFQRLRLECHPRPRRQRPGHAVDRRFSEFPDDQRPADAHHRRTATSATALPISRTPMPPTVSRSVRKKSSWPRRIYGWPEDAQVPGAGRRARAFPRWHRQTRQANCSAAVERIVQQIRQAIPDLADNINRMQRRELPDGWDKNLPDISCRPEGRRHPRKLRQSVECGRAEHSLAGGWLGRPGHLQQDHLKFEGAGDFQAGNYAGRNFHFGVREHAMARALNGMALCKLRAFGGTFFNFTDYMRPSMRLAAIMEIPTIYVLTHDSIGLGEDGPTHQPVEQLASLARHARHDNACVPAMRTKWSKRGR